jgi:hypothetical protein
VATLSTIFDRAGVSGLGVLDAQIDVPILTGAQRQGDVIVLPRDGVGAATPIPAAGVVVVRAETSAGNTHVLLSWDGQCFFDAAAGDGLTLGTLTVPDDASAYLVHSDEHGANGIGPGTYILRRQREYAGEWRAVAD